MQCARFLHFLRVSVGDRDRGPAPLSEVAQAASLRTCTTPRPSVMLKHLARSSTTPCTLWVCHDTLARRNQLRARFASMVKQTPLVRLHCFSPAAILPTCVELDGDNTGRPLQSLLLSLLQPILIPKSIPRVALSSRLRLHHARLSAAAQSRNSVWSIHESFTAGAHPLRPLCSKYLGGPCDDHLPDPVEMLSSATDRQRPRRVCTSSHWRPGKDAQLDKSIRRCEIKRGWRVTKSYLCPTLTT